MPKLSTFISYLHIRVTALDVATSVCAVDVLFNLRSAIRKSGIYSMSDPNDPTPRENIKIELTETTSKMLVVALKDCKMHVKLSEDDPPSLRLPQITGLSYLELLRSCLMITTEDIVTSKSQYSSPATTMEFALATSVAEWDNSQEALEALRDVGFIPWSILYVTFDQRMSDYSRGTQSRWSTQHSVYEGITRFWGWFIAEAQTSTLHEALKEQALDGGALFVLEILSIFSEGDEFGAWGCNTRISILAADLNSARFMIPQSVCRNLRLILQAS